MELLPVKRYGKFLPLNNTVIAFLTARGEDYSQIAGFEAGADDYITKPVRPKVLISRVKAFLNEQVKVPAPVAVYSENATTVSIGSLGYR
jgi:two-component system, OmpR family, alkaline phosphatase synthesis response regulator PhoP